jgi:5-methylthioribose kinase
MSYYILDTQNLPSFLLNIDTVLEYFNDTTFDIQEIGDGNLNFVFIVSSCKDPQKSLIVKQAVPYLRIAGEGFPLSRERMNYEIRALELYSQSSPQYIPKIYHADEAMSVVIMQNLSEHIILRKGLIDKIIYPKFAEDISTFMTQTLFSNSSLALSSTKKRALMDKFNHNTELCKLTEDFVFTFAFMDNDTNEIDLTCKEEAEELFSDMAFKKQVLKLKYIFMTQSDTLLHGDLHTGSIMANPDETYIIDPEFAFIGPFGFDIGALVANIINVTISHHYLSHDSDYQQYLFETLYQILTQFQSKFLALWDTQEESALITEGYINDEYLSHYKQEFMKTLFSQSIGFAGAKMARRVFGIAGVEEIRGIENDEIRKKAMLSVLRVAKILVMQYETINDADTLILKIKEAL